MRRRLAWAGTLPRLDLGLSLLIDLNQHAHLAGVHFVEHRLDCVVLLGVVPALPLHIPDEAGEEPRSLCLGDQWAVGR